MSYFTGKATGTNDLLDIIKDKSINQGYVLNRDRVEGSPLTRELILTTYNGTMIGFKIHNISTSYAGYDFEENVNLQLNAGPTYDDLQTFSDQPNSFLSVNNENTGAFCRENEITYHLSITAGRILCAYSIENYYYTFYLGNYWAYDTPVNLPNPVFISGNNNYETSRETLSESGSSNFIGGNGYETGTIDNFQNWIMQQSNSSWTSSSLKLCMAPFLDGSSNADDIIFNKDGSILLYPVTLSNNEKNYLFGELDGVYMITPYAGKEGDVINDGENDYLIIKSKTTGRYSDGLFAIKLK